MRVFDRIGDAFISNPWAWIMFGLLILAEYGSYTNGRAMELDLMRVCELTGPHDALAAAPGTPQDEIDNICIRNEPRDP